jgi:hypothetical protein
MPKGFKVNQDFQLALALAVVIWLGCSLRSEDMGLWSWSLEKISVGEDGEEGKKKERK